MMPRKSKSSVIIGGILVFLFVLGAVADGLGAWSGIKEWATSILYPSSRSDDRDNGGATSSNRVAIDPIDTPLLISGELIPEPGVYVWFSENPVQDETAVYPQIRAFYPQVSTVEMQIESLQETQNIRLSKPALLRISDFAQSETKQVYVGFPMGGWDYYHHFTAELSPEFKGKVLEATRLENTDSQQEEIAGYNIYPGDVEVFKFHLNFLQPGIYVFDIGLEYVFQGQRRQLWVPESFPIQVPETYYVRDWMTGTYSKTTFAELSAGF